MRRVESRGRKREAENEFSMEHRRKYRREELDTI